MGEGLPLPAEASFASPGGQVQPGDSAAVHKVLGVGVGPEDVPRNSSDTSVVAHDSRQGNLAQGPALSLGENTLLLPPEPSKVEEELIYTMSTCVCQVHYFIQLSQNSCKIPIIPIL